MRSFVLRLRISSDSLQSFSSSSFANEGPSWCSGPAAVRILAQSAGGSVHRSGPRFAAPRRSQICNVGNSFRIAEATGSATTDPTE